MELDRNRELEVRRPENVIFLVCLLQASDFDFPASILKHITND